LNAHALRLATRADADPPHTEELITLRSEDLLAAARAIGEGNDLFTIQRKSFWRGRQAS
jgi:hypothetical protein